MMELLNFMQLCYPAEVVIWYHTAVTVLVTPSVWFETKAGKYA